VRSKRDLQIYAFQDLQIYAYKCCCTRHYFLIDKGKERGRFLFLEKTTGPPRRDLSDKRAAAMRAGGGVVRIACQVPPVVLRCLGSHRFGGLPHSVAWPHHVYSALIRANTGVLLCRSSQFIVESPGLAHRRGRAPATRRCAWAGMHA